jgi:hypothetical protein
MAGYFPPARTQSTDIEELDELARNWLTYWVLDMACVTPRPGALAVSALASCGCRSWRELTVVDRRRDAPPAGVPPTGTMPLRSHPPAAGAFARRAATFESCS